MPNLVPARSTMPPTPPADTVRADALPGRSDTTTTALLTCGLIAGPLYLVVGFAQAFTRDGFSPMHDDLSVLANGPLGWIQVANLILTGALVLACAVGTYRALGGGPGSTWGPRLLGGYGAGLVMAGIFRADPMYGFPPGHRPARQRPPPCTAPCTLSLQRWPSSVSSAPASFSLVGSPHQVSAHGPPIRGSPESCSWPPSPASRPAPLPRELSSPSPRRSSWPSPGWRRSHTGFDGASAEHGTPDTNADVDRVRCEGAAPG